MSAYESLTPVQSHSREAHASSSWPALAGLALVLLGAGVLIGWLLDIPLLLSIRPGWVSMKPNAAVGLFLSGIALWQLRHHPLTGWALRLGQACAGLAALIGLLTLAEYLLRWDLGIDDLLFADSLQAVQTSTPGRMGPNSASAMLFGNVALLLLAASSRRRARLAAAGALAILTILLGAFGAMAYIGGVFAEYSWERFTGVALHSGLAFVLLGCAGLRIAWTEGGSRWSVGAPVVVGSGLGMLLLIGLSLESLRTTRQYVEMSRWVEHTQEVRTTISDLNAGLAIAISGERGFVITGHDEYLQPFKQGNRQAVEMTQRLRELTADNPRQQARLVQLGTLLQQKIEFTSEVVETRFAGGVELAASLISSGLGRDIHDAIYAITQQMEDEERGLLARRKADSSASIARAFIILPSGTLLALGLFLAVLLNLNAEVTERRRSAAAVRESEARLQSILDNAPTVVWVKDMDGRYTHVNRAFEKIFGLVRDRVIGKTDRELFSNKAADQFHEFDHQTLNRQSKVEAVETVEIDGEAHVFLSVRVALRDGEAAPYLLCGIFSDITDREVAAVALRKSETRFRSLVLSTSQIIWWTDASGQVSGPLPTWQEFTGQSDAEVQGAGWANSLHPDDVANATNRWAQALESRSLLEVDYRIRRRDGIYRDFSVRGAPVLDRDGSVLEWVGSCTDVTDRHKAEAERDRFFSLSLDLMCIARMDGFFHRINPAFERVLGFTQTELLSRPFMDFVHPHDHESTLGAIALLAAGQALVNFENRYRCKDGSSRWFLWSCIGVPEEGLIYAAARDISDRKQAEADIRQLNAELDQRVIERTAQLEAANRELEAFTYSVSHDLRAPLRGVDSFSRMVIEDYGPQLDDEGRRMLNVVRSESQRMGQLIDDLLDFSRVGRLEMRLQSIDMTALVRSVIENLDLSAEREQQISVGPLVQAYGDRNLIQQIWVNLLSNALKFTMHQPMPVIEVGVSVTDELATYHVKDNGAGFDSRYVHKLFGVFQRLHTEEEFEGTGVGLALVQRIVHRHGGSVRAEGEVNKGAAFYFSLPVAKEHRP